MNCFRKALLVLFITLILPFGVKAFGGISFPLHSNNSPLNYPLPTENSPNLASAYSAYLNLGYNTNNLLLSSLNLGVGGLISVGDVILNLINYSSPSLYANIQGTAEALLGIQTKQGVRITKEVRPPSSGSGGLTSSSSPNTYPLKTNTSPLISSSGLTLADLTSRLSALRAELLSVVNSASAFQPRQLDAVIRGINQSPPNTTATDLSSISGSTITASTFSGTSVSTTLLTVSGTATSTLSGDVAFDTNTLYIDSLNNRVGIGTTSPNDTLAVEGPLLLASTTVPGNTTDRLYNNFANLYWNGNLIAGGAIGTWSTAGGNVYRGTGKVGVGTSSPYAPLSVVGEIVGSYFTATTTATSTFGGPIVVGGSTATSTVAGNLSVTGNINLNGLLLQDDAPFIGSQWTTSGSNIYYTSGNVGIGTTTPRWLLQLASSTAPQLALTSGPLDNHWVFNNTGGNLVISTSSPTSFATSTLNALTVNSSNNVGIATNTPWATLAVNPQAGLASNQFVVGSSTATSFIVDNAGKVGVGTTSPWAQLSVNPNGVTGPAFAIGSSTATKLVVTNGGLVGIGTAAPEKLLHVSGTSASSQIVLLDNYGAVPEVSFRRANGTLASPTAAVSGDNLGQISVFGYGATGFGSNRVVRIQALAAENFTDSAKGTDLGFQTANIGTVNATEKMRLTNAGNIGIGTTSPFSRLQIATTSANVTFKPQLTLTDTNAGTDAKHWSLTSANGNFYIGTSSDAYATSTFLTIGNNRGYVGIGSTTPYAKLSVNPVAGDAAGFVVGSSTATNFIVDNGGNVGIGTTSPWAQLSVNPNGVSGPAFAVGSSTKTDFIVNNAGKVGIGQSPGVSANGPYIFQVTETATSTAIPSATFLANGGFGYFTDNLTSHGVILGTAKDNDRPFIIGRRSRGSLDTPAVVVAEDQIFSFLASGYDGSAFQNAALINFIADGTPTTGFVPMRISFTTGGSASTRAERLTIKNTGQVGIGTTTPFSLLQIASSSASSTFKPQLTLTDTNAGADAKHWSLTSANGNFEIGTSSDTYATTSYLTIAIGGYTGVKTLAGASASDLCYDTTTITGMNTLATCSSALRYKENVTDLSLGGLETVKKLRPVSFTWKKDGISDFGFIAEEVEAISPLLATYYNGQLEGVKYKQLTAVLVKAIQEQQLQINSLLSGSTTPAFGDLSLTDALWNAITGKLSSLGVFVENTLTRITNLFADTIHIENKLCVDDVCVNKDQLKALLIQAGGTSSGPSNLSTSDVNNIPTSDTTVATSTDTTASTPSTGSTPSMNSGQASSPQGDSGQATTSDISSTSTSPETTTTTPSEVVTPPDTTVVETPPAPPVDSTAVPTPAPTDAPSQ